MPPRSREDPDLVDERAASSARVASRADPSQQEGPAVGPLGAA